MPLRIKSRVRHLADAADHNVIQRALCIEVGPPATLNWPSVSRQKRFARIDIADRADGTIGAYLFAHPTANTGMGNIPDLLDDRQGPVFMDRLGLAALRYGDRPARYPGFNCSEGTRSHTAAAHRTAVKIIFYFPVEIIDRNILCLYCFHLCTSKSLPMTTTSRSFG